MHYRAPVLVLLIVGLTACRGPSSGPVFSLEVLEPATDLTIGLGYGGVLEIAYSDHDSSGTSETDLFADADGDLSTKADQFLLAVARPERNGAVQRLAWNVAGTPYGLYHVMARMRSASEEIVAEAPGLVRLDAPPSFEIHRPDPAAVTCRDGILRLTCESTDPDGPVRDYVFADEDGNVLTAGDQYPLLDGAPGDVLRDELIRAWGVPPGAYSVFGRAVDDINPDAQAAAPDGLAVLNVGWMHAAGAAEWASGTATATYDDFSSVVAGTFQNAVTFGVGTPAETTLEPVKYQDLCLARHAPDGSLVWARSAGGDGQTYVRDVDGGPTGACYVVGTFNGTMTFGAGETGERTLESVGSSGYVAKYDVDGAVSWVQQVASGGYADVGGVKALADGGVVVVGLILMAATLDPGGPNETTLTPVGAHDVFVARYTAAGTLAWVRQAGGPGIEAGRRIAVLLDGSFVVCGHCSDLAVFGAGDPGETRVDADALPDAFVARYLPDGTFSWVTTAGGAQWESATDVAACADGSCVVTGTFIDEITLGAGGAAPTTLSGAGERDGFVAQYTLDGRLLWGRGFGGPKFDVAEALTAFPDGSVVVTGAFPEEATFAGGTPSQTRLVSAGLDDAFYACYDAGGRLKWARALGGLGDDCGWAVNGFADGSFLAAGAFEGVVVFGPGDPGETVRVANGHRDLFVARFNGDGGL